MSFVHACKCCGLLLSSWCPAGEPYVLLCSPKSFGKKWLAMIAVAAPWALFSALVWSLSRPSAALLWAALSPQALFGSSWRRLVQVSKSYLGLFVLLVRVDGPFTTALSRLCPLLGTRLSLSPPPCSGMFSHVFTWLSMQQWRSVSNLILSGIFS